MAGSISDQTTVLSNLSVERNLSTGTLTGGPLHPSQVSSTGTVAGTLVWGSDLSSTNTVRGALVFGSDLSSTNTMRAALAVIGGGTAITKIAKGTISIVTMTVVGGNSSSTTAAVSGLSTVDTMFVMAPTASGLSANLIVQAYSSGSGIATIVFSNISSAVTSVQAGPVNYPYVAFRS